MKFNFEEFDLDVEGLISDKIDTMEFNFSDLDKPEHKDGMGRSRAVDFDTGSSTVGADIVIPEDGMFTVNKPKWETTGSVRGLNQPIAQAGVGAIKAYDVVSNVLSGASSPWEIANDPGRVLDYGVPFMNFGLASAEWLTQKASNLASGVAGAEEEEVKFPRVPEMGSYPERDTPMGKELKAQSDWRKGTVQDFESSFKKQTGSAPYITTAMGFIPDMLTIYGGAAMNAPKVAAGVESILSGAHAMTEGEDSEAVGQSKVLGAVGGYMAAKTVNAFMNKLSPQESKMIEQVSLDPQMKQDTIEIMKFYKDHPNFEINSIIKGETGNPYMDSLLDRQKQEMGNEMYSKYVETLSGLGGKAKGSLDDITSEFHDQSEDLYKKMSSNATGAWDNLGTKLDNSQTISTDQLVSSIDETLINAPDVVKQFSSKLMKNTDNMQAIEDIGRKKTSLHSNYLADVEVARDIDAEAVLQAGGGISDTAKKIKSARAAGKSEAEIIEKFGLDKGSIKTKYAADLKALNDEKALLEGMDAESALNLSPVDIIDKIKNLNNKEFVAGGNINTKDKKQAAAMTQLRKTLENSLEGFPDVGNIRQAYDHAKASSSDVFSTFGYSGGKNKGSKVFNPELQKVLEEEYPGQLKILDGMMNESPATFTSKMQNMSKVLPESLTKNMKRYYLERKISSGVVKGTKTGENPRMEPEAFEANMRDMLDTADGRKMIIDNYGEDTLKNLSLIRGVNRDLGEAASQGKLPEATSSLWPTDLYGAVKGVLSNRVSDYMYTSRVLRGYGEKAGVDLGEEFNKNVAARVGAGAAGGIVAPEGNELEGMAVGSSVGNAGYVANLLKKFITKGK